MHQLRDQLFTLRSFAAQSQEVLIIRSSWVSHLHGYHEFEDKEQKEGDEEGGSSDVEKLLCYEEGFMTFKTLHLLPVLCAILVKCLD